LSELLADFFDYLLPRIETNISVYFLTYFLTYLAAHFAAAHPNYIDK
jgi:hypothetical protein